MPISNITARAAFEAGEIAALRSQPYGCAAADRTILVLLRELPMDNRIEALIELSENWNAGYFTGSVKV